MWDISVMGSSTHTIICLIIDIRVDLMMNIEVLEEKPFNSYWLSCNILLVVWFVFPGCFMSLNYWVFSILVILSVWLWSMKVYKVYNLKLEMKSWNSHWEEVGRCASQSFQCLVDQVSASRVSGDPACFRRILYCFHYFLMKCWGVYPNIHLTSCHRQIDSQIVS